MSESLPDPQPAEASPGPSDPPGPGSVADMQRVLEELAAQRAFLRQVIDLNPSFIFAKDREGRFMLVNQAVAEAYGTTVEGLIGKTDADFNSNAEEVEHFRRDDLEVMDTGVSKLITEEAITDSKGRTRWLQTIKRAIVGSDGVANQVLGVATDITARRALEQQLAEAQKMQAIGRLAGGVAHDFNNLLTVILGSSDALLAGLEAEHALHSNATQIHDAAERGAILTRQLLAFGRKQLLQPRVIDLNQVVKDSEPLLGHLIGEHIALAVRCDAVRANVRADPVQITLVILNLATNARDAMQEGGTLTLRTGEVHLDGAYAAAHPDVTPGPYALIAVSDTGTGIDPRVRPHLFEPFFSTKPPGLGTGLGLATAHGIVSQSGGHITVESEPGRGTTFFVYLPRVEEPAEIVEPHVDEVPGGAETILLVEDEAMVRNVASRILRAKGYHVLEAANGIEGLAQAKAHVGPIDLLVTDVVMPHMGGIELAVHLHRVRPNTRVLYTSGYSEQFIERGEFEVRGEFLPKPYHPNTFTRRVRALLDAPSP